MTTSLSSRSAEAVQRLHELRQIKDIAKSVDAFKQRRDQLAAEEKAFRDLAARVQLLRSHKIPVAVPRLVWFLQEEFAKIQTNFESAPDSLAQANLQIVFNQSTKCRQELVTALQLAWEGYVDTQRLKLDAAILNVLSAVPSFRNAVADLVELDGQIQTRRARLPRSEEDFAGLHHDVGEMRRIWDELGGEGLPKEVLNFLKIAGNRSIGAPLDLLDKVHPWLKERGLEASFRVVISG
jgi:hypothetical protein